MHFSDAQNRVYSVSLVHQLLHREQGVQHIELREYLSTQVRELVQVPESSVETIISGESVHLPADQAIPLGPIKTGLMLNALKHAFPGGRSGHLALQVWLTGILCTVRISDDGFG